jgi:hypothetical protein
MTAKIWENWEHGPDGNQYVELYRQYAAEQLGLKVPTSPMAPGGYLNYLTERGFGGSSTETAKGHATAMLNAIANGSPTQPALYRGIVAQPTDINSQNLIKQLSNLKPGETIDMPLVSTTRSLGVAAWYAADRVAGASDKVIMKIQPGARGVSMAAKNSYYPADHEVVTSGKFEVVGVTHVTTPYCSRGVFEPRKANLTDGTTHYEVATYSPVRYNEQQAKNIWDTVQAGKIQSLATNTLKFTNDRNPRANGNPVFSSWTKEAPTGFTVVEVKMVEPHVVQKAIDHGMIFDSLFNDRPFINDDPESVTKFNPNHDEVGRFATATAGTLGASTLDGAYKGFTISGDERSTLHKYTGNGYKDMNSALRGTNQGSGGDEVTLPSTLLDIETMDALIQRAPIVKSETPVFRVFNAYLVTGLKPGYVYVDKGYMSTTLVDISAKKGRTIRNHLGDIEPTMDVVGRIKPNGHNSGLSLNHAEAGASPFPKEQEFILPRGSQLKYLGFEKASSGETIMNFERMNG